MAPAMSNMTSQLCELRAAVSSETHPQICLYIPAIIWTETERQRREAGVIKCIEKGSGNVCIYGCVSFEHFSRMRAFTEPKVVPCGSVVDNTLLRHVFGALVFPARSWHVHVVPIGLILWPGQLPSQLHEILAQIPCYQN